VQRNYAIEIGKGFTEAIDLRPDPDVRRPLVRGVKVTPKPATENGARETVGGDRAAGRRDS
jgi:hypothetical protein